MRTTCMECGEFKETLLELHGNMKPDRFPIRLCESCATVDTREARDLMIDLCCGQGRFPGNDVISIDTNPSVRPTIVADVRHLPLREGLKVERVHASPPCTWLSWARIRKHGYNEKMLAESLEIVAACFRAFDYLGAQTWTMENPGTGMLQRILPPDGRTQYDAYDIRGKRAAFWSNSKGLKRALIPQNIREGLARI